MPKPSLLTRSKKKQALALFQRQQYQEAASIYARIVQLDPLDAEAWFMNGKSQEHMGDMAAAEACLRRAAEIDPNHPDYQFNLANSLHAQGKHAEATPLYQLVLKIKPDFPSACFNLGIIYQAQNKLNEAAMYYVEVLRLAPSAEAHHNLGFTLDKLGRPDDAIAQFEASLRLKPTAMGYSCLANVYLHKDQPQEAVANYNEALRLDPNQAATHINLGVAWRSLGDYDKALASFREALKLDPGSVAALCNIGQILSQWGRLDESSASFHQALQIDPGSLHAQIGEITNLERRRDYAAAYTRLQPLLANDVSVAAAMTFAELCRHVHRCDDAITLLEGVLERNVPPLNIKDRSRLHFELGRLLDAKSEYDEAFNHYRHGNELLAKEFSIAGLTREFDELIATFNPDFLAKAPRASTTSQRPLFIIGMPRSGTSLVEQIIASHPQVAAGGELNDLETLIKALPETLGTSLPFPQCLTDLTVDACNRLSQRYLERLQAISPNALRVTDKMPGNFKYLAFITLLFPNARIIHCIRDPRDTCLSCYFQYFETAHPYSYDLAHLGATYRQYQRLMQHWREVTTLSFMEVHYEDLVTNQEQVTRNLIAFCDLPWNDRCLSFNESDRVVNTASYDQVRQPIYQRSINRWRHYQTHLEPLMKSL